MNLRSVLSLLSIASVLASESTTVKTTPQQLRTSIKKSRSLDDNGTTSLNRGEDVFDGLDESTPENNCFSAMNVVEVQNKGFVSIDSLNIGDYIRVKNDNFSRVFSFAHLDRERETNFYQIHTVGLEEPLEITGRHYIFASNNKAVRADSLKIGDMLGSHMVSEIQTVKRIGVYAPITESGNLMVSNLLASSYVSFLDEIYLDENAMTHMFFAPQRVACRINFSWCENETYSKEGYSKWSNWAIKIMLPSSFLPVAIQNFLSVVGLVTVSIWATAEQIYLAPLIPIPLVVYTLYKTRSKSTI